MGSECTRRSEEQAMLPSKKQILSLIALFMLLLAPVSAYQPAGASALWVVLTDANFRSAPPEFDDRHTGSAAAGQKPAGSLPEPLGDDVFSAARAIYTPVSAARIHPQSAGAAGDPAWRRPPFTDSLPTFHQNHAGHHRPTLERLPCLPGRGTPPDAGIGTGIAP
jgi:hypothetical protein